MNANPDPSNIWARCHPRTYPRPLDRYGNIYPWNNNRIYLKVPRGKVGYINASPIELHSPSAPERIDRYIAMQGPTFKSWPHVWRMVAEQLDSPAVIVMLTETHEASGQEKCFEYFPRLSTTDSMVVEDEFGDGFKAAVRCESLETHANGAIELRKIVIRIEGLVDPDAEDPDCRPEENAESDLPYEDDQDGGVAVNLSRVSTSSDSTDFATDSTDSRGNSPSKVSIRPQPSLSPAPSVTISTMHRQQAEPPKLGDERVVYHFLYKKWPDFGVPSVFDLDSFFTLMRMSREYNGREDNPRIVHCSAGVGRSGTFIALEHIMRELETGYLERYDETWAVKLSAPASNRSSSVDVDDVERASSVSFPGGGGVPIDTNGNGAPPKTCHAGRQTSSEMARAEALSRPPPRNETAPDLIYETVDALRRQRKMMVQAPSQYLFLYDVLTMLWREKYARSDGEPAAKRLEVCASAE